MKDVPFVIRGTVPLLINRIPPEIDGERVWRDSVGNLVLLKDHLLGAFHHGIRAMQVKERKPFAGAIQDKRIDLAQNQLVLFDPVSRAPLRTPELREMPVFTGLTKNTSGVVTRSEWETTKAPNGTERVTVMLPQIDNWCVAGTLIVADDIKLASLKHAIMLAGLRIGLGYYRPRSHGDFGKFRLVEWDNAPLDRNGMRLVTHADKTPPPPAQPLDFFAAHRELTLEPLADHPHRDLARGIEIAAAHGCAFGQHITKFVRGEPDVDRYLAEEAGREFLPDASQTDALFLRLAFLTTALNAVHRNKWCQEHYRLGALLQQELTIARLRLTRPLWTKLTRGQETRLCREGTWTTDIIGANATAYVAKELITLNARVFLPTLEEDTCGKIDLFTILNDQGVCVQVKSGGKLAKLAIHPIGATSGTGTGLFLQGIDDFNRRYGLNWQGSYVHVPARHTMQ